MEKAAGTRQFSQTYAHSFYRFLRREDNAFGLLVLVESNRSVKKDELMQIFLSEEKFVYHSKRAMSNPDLRTKGESLMLWALGTFSS